MHQYHQPCIIARSFFFAPAMSQFSWSIIGLSDSDDDTLQDGGLTPAVGTAAEAPAAIGAAADAVLSARAPAALGGVPGPAATSTKLEEKPTVADASAAMTTAAVAPVTPPAMRTDAASAVAARRPLPGVPTAKRTRTAVETLDEHRLHRLWWFDVVPVTLRVRAQNSAVSLCFPDTEPDNIDGWLSHCHRIIRRWSSLHRHHCRPCQAILGGPLAKRLRHHGRHRGCPFVERVGAHRARSLGSSQRAPSLREHSPGWRDPYSRLSSLRVRRRSHRPYAKPPLRKQSQAAFRNRVRHRLLWFCVARFVSSAAFVHVSSAALARTSSGEPAIKQHIYIYRHIIFIYSYIHI